MRRRVALLRGVNVGGHGKLPMQAFRTLLGSLGYAHVASYIQSGNAVFEADGPAELIAAEIAEGIAAGFGFRPVVIVREAGAFAQAVAGQPFETPGDPRQVHLVFHAPGTRADLAALNAAARDGEEVRAGAGLTYFHTPNGFGKSRLTGQLARYFDGPITARNLRTARKIAELAIG